MKRLDYLLTILDYKFTALKYRLGFITETEAVARYALPIIPYYYDDSEAS